MDELRALLSAWQTAIAGAANRRDGSLRLGAPEFNSLHRSLAEAAEHAELGALKETLGHANLLFGASGQNGHLAGLLFSLGDLVQAAHWYRLSGDLERSRLIAERALLELGRFRPNGETHLHPPQYWPYLLEMQGDAAVCVDPDKARQFYAEASDAFDSQDEQTQAFESVQIFPGEYTSYMQEHFLPWNPGIHNRGRERIGHKTHCWLLVQPDFDPDYLRQQMTGLTQLHAVAFAAACCERMLPGYVRFQAQTGWGDADGLRDALDVIWSLLEGEDVSPERLQAIRDRCERVIPDTEDFETPAVSDALDASSSISETLALCLDGDISHAINVAAVAMDTAERLAQESERMRREWTDQVTFLLTLRAFDLPDRYWIGLFRLALQQR